MCRHHLCPCIKSVISLQLLQASPELMELGLSSSDWWPLNHHFTADHHARDSTGSLYITTVSPRASSKKQPPGLCRKLLPHGLRGSDWCNLVHSRLWFARLSSDLLLSARKQNVVPCVIMLKLSLWKKRWSWLQVFFLYKGGENLNDGVTYQQMQVSSSEISICLFLFWFLIISTPESYWTVCLLLLKRFPVQTVSFRAS